MHSYSGMVYCIAIWGCTWPSFLDKLLKAQKRILRIISFKKKFESTEGIFSNLKLLKLNYIHKYFLLLDIFKSVNNNDGIFNIQEHPHATRRNHVNLSSRPFRTTLFRNSIFYLGPEVWNSLPVSLKSEVTSMPINSFKYKIKQHFYHLQSTE